MDRHEEGGSAKGRKYAEDPVDRNNLPQKHNKSSGVVLSRSARLSTLTGPHALISKMVKGQK